MPPAAASSATCTAAQRHLVSLALDLRAAQATAPPGAGELVQQRDEVAAGMDGVLEELCEITRRLHPAILADGGLAPPLKAPARRSAVPVGRDIQVQGRLPEPVEIAAYYTIAEALTNTAKHACGTTAQIQVSESDAVMHVRVRDNGRGGAGFSRGSGLVGAQGPRRSRRRPPRSAQPARDGHHLGDHTGPQRLRARRPGNGGTHSLVTGRCRMAAPGSPAALP